MAMIRYTDEPGSPAWHARRARCFNAGDASAMLGCHPSGYTRSQLLQDLHTGIEREFSDYVQIRVLTPGHRIEALWRPIAEAILGEDLQVLAGTLDLGLSRPLGASLDGITFMEDTLAECKSANESLRAALPNTGRDSHERNDARQLPKGYRVQLEQQQLVAGATRTLFSACQFNADGSVAEERHCWYASDPALRAEIIAGWKQFAIDLAAYTVPEVLDKAAIVGHRPDQLPALRSSVKGELVLESNIKEWEAAALEYIKSVRDHDLKTDEDFANADAAAKWCDASKTSLEGVRAQLMGATGDVNVAVGTLDRIMDELDKTRIAFNNAIKARKDARKVEIVDGGKLALAAHILALNKRLGKDYMPVLRPEFRDFAGAIKGRSSIAKMQDAVDALLASAKIEANRIADCIQTNLNWLREHAKDHSALFPDTGAIVLKAHDDLVALAQNRINEHKAAEEKRLEAERERIRQEEQAKAEKAARDRQEEEDLLVGSFEAAARRIEHDSVPYIQKAITAYESVAKDWESDPRPRVREAFLAGRTYLKDRMESAQARQAAEAAKPAQPPTPAPIAPPAVSSQAVAANSPNVVPIQRSTAEKPTLTLGEINARLGITMTSAFVRQLGIAGTPCERGVVRYRESELDLICEALKAHITTVQDQYQRQVA